MKGDHIRGIWGMDDSRGNLHRSAEYKKLPPKEALSRAQWSLLQAVEALLRITLDHSALRRFTAFFGEDNLPLESVLAVLECSTNAEDFLRNAQRLVTIRPRDPHCLRVLTLALGNAGQLQFAIATAQRAVKLAPEDLRIVEEFAHWQRYAGYSMANTSWVTKAALVFDELTELDPDNSDYPFQAALLKQDLRMFRPAEDSFRQAILRDPNHARAYRFLADLLKNRGANYEAQRAYVQAAEIFAEQSSQTQGLMRERLFQESKEAYIAATEVGYSKEAVAGIIGEVP